MIKGRYVATLEIEFSIPENEPGLMPFDKLTENWKNNATDEFEKALAEEVEPFGNVKLTQQYVDVYRCDEQEGER